MKGIVFTEFLDMVEREYGEEMLEEIIDDAQLPSGGAYTAVGSYPSSEMGQLVHQLSLKSKLSHTALLEKFGHVLFSGLYKAYPYFFQEEDLFSFLSTIHTHIHVEVKKLYADAELPSLHVLERTDDQIVLLYESPRRMSDLARGLLQASILHYQAQAVTLSEEFIEPDGSAVKFTLTRT